MSTKYKIAEFNESITKDGFGFNVTVHENKDGSVKVESNGLLKDAYESFENFMVDLIDKNPLWFTYYFVRVNEKYETIIKEKLKKSTETIFYYLNTSIVNTGNNWSFGDNYLNNFVLNEINFQIKNSAPLTHKNEILFDKKHSVEIDQMWNGYCPECLLKERNVKMQLNKNDFYECEVSALQISVLTGVQAIIMNFKGKGDFKSEVKYAHDIENGELLSPQNIISFPYNNPTKIFNSSEEIINYIKTIKND